jgi:hypothetical protein
VDAWLKDDGSAVLVLRGAPRFDPAAFKSERGAEWLAGRPIGARVTEHAPAPGGAGVWLYAVPDGTYVIARGRAVAKTRATLAHGGRSPPALEADEGSLATAWLDGAFAARHVAAGQALEGVSSSAATLVPAAEITGVLHFSFDSDARAAASEKTLGNALEKTCGPVCGKLGQYIHVARSGHELRADLRMPGEVLEEARRAFCTPAEPKPEAHPLPADPNKPDVMPPRVAQWNGRDLLVAWAPVETRGAPEPVLQLGVYDERGKLLHKVDTPTSAWGPIALAAEPAVVANRIALRTSPGAITLFDLANGKRVTEVAVPAHGRMCASAAEGLLFVDDDDAARRTLISIDAEPKVIPSTRPPWCPPHGRAAACEQPTTVAACADASIAPQIADLVPSHVLLAGDDAVVLGERLSDRHVPIAVGFDPKKRAVRWKRVLPTASPDVAAEGSPRIADIANGKLLVEFDDWHGRWKLAALDVKTGAPAWEAALAEPAYFTVSPTRLFYAEITRPPHGARFRALDLTSGR